MEEKKKINYKINFWRADKIEVNKMKCGNCGKQDSQMFACKYSMKEYDDFSKKVVLKSKSAKLCGKCNYVVTKLLERQEAKKESSFKITEVETLEELVIKEIDADDKRFVMITTSQPPLTVTLAEIKAEESEDTGEDENYVSTYEKCKVLKVGEKHEVTYYDMVTATTKIFTTFKRTT